ncbi:MAG: hypothetical protein J6X92_04840, partial [Bacteroidales bacterium]|nr:hypothetical protein [Bacteroidales bacterium]
MNISDSIYVSEVDSFIYSPVRQLEDISVSDVELFPYTLTNQNKRYEEQTYTELSSHLKEGKPVGTHLLHEDWLLFIILFVIGVYSLINYYMGRMTGDVLSFLSFRHVSDSEDSDDDYSSSSLNVSWRGFFVFMASVTSLALYLYCCLTYYDVFKFLPKQLSSHVWLIAVCFGSIIIALAFRLFLCTLTGGISGQKKLFSEYIDTVYNGYKFI